MRHPGRERRRVPSVLVVSDAGQIAIYQEMGHGPLIFLQRVMTTAWRFPQRRVELDHISLIRNPGTPSHFQVLSSASTTLNCLPTTGSSLTHTITRNARYEVFTAVKIQVRVFRVGTPFSVVVGYRHF